MVLTSSGEILTNNHVVDGATSITVTVVSTGAKYTAAVVGTDPTQDVAVLQLQNANGPADDQRSATRTRWPSATRSPASATPAAPAAPRVPPTGTVTALDQQITAADEYRLERPSTSPA